MLVPLYWWALPADRPVTSPYPVTSWGGALAMLLVALGTCGLRPAMLAVARAAPRSFPGFARMGANAKRLHPRDATTLGDCVSR